jgi:two-component system response regulator HydG
LASHFLAEFSEKNGRELDGITTDAVGILSAYDWPGNVRELRNTIEKMVVLARGDRLTARDIPANIRDAVRAAGPVIPVAPPAGGSESLADNERRMILGALKRADGNRTKAAEALGISRRTLHRKLKQYQEEVGDE